MAESVPPTADPGAPIARDAIDPDLIKLSRSKLRIGVITAAGIVLLCVLFLVRLSADRHFSGHTGKPVPTQVSDVLAGKVDLDSYIAVDAEPIVGNAIRATPAKGNLGLRVVPARGTSDRLWLVVPGNGWLPANVGGYAGRLRRLADLPFATAAMEFAATHPRPVFAPIAAVRAGFATGKVATVDGDTVALTDRDRVQFELVDPDAAIGARFHDATEWTKALTEAGVTVGALPTTTEDQVRYEVAAPGGVAALTTKLEKAALWAARVEPVTRRYDTTWGALRASPATGLTVGPTTVPDAELDLVGLYISRGIPDGAYAIVVGDQPADYWFVLPVTIALGLIGLVFAWALYRAVRRDLLPARA